MRDPERIDIICQKLAEIWKQVPDLRLSQIICNVQTYYKSDCYYIEDEKFITDIENYIRSIKF